MSRPGGENPMAVPFGFLLLWPLVGDTAEGFTFPGGAEGSSGQWGAMGLKPLTCLYFQ